LLLTVISFFVFQTLTSTMTTPAPPEQHSQHPQQPSLQESAEQISQLFATTVTSLAADVNALKHLTTWKEIIDGRQNGSEEEFNQDLHREEFLESLCDLDDVVTAVEKKVVVLRQIVAEEQRALDKLDMLQRDSLEQNENLRYLVDRCRSIKISSSNAQSGGADENNPHNNNHKGSSSRPSSTTTATSTNRGKQNQSHGNNQSSSGSRTPFSIASSSYGNESAGSRDEGSHTSTHGSHAHIEGLSCYFDAVTDQELQAVPRTTRGRVQIGVINDALVSIEKCFHKKAIKERRQEQLLADSRLATLPRYQKASHEEIDDEELLHNLIVTEQELRQSCTFFTAGEGTARTVLAVLKALRRIKQIPAKERGLFCYKLCVD
jgi:hypothetical protein